VVYVEYQTEERELQDPANDPYELENRYYHSVASALLAALKARLDS